MKRSNPKSYARPRFPGQNRGTIGARIGEIEIAPERFFQSTEAGSAVEYAARAKYPHLALPRRHTLVRPRAFGRATQGE